MSTVQLRKQRLWRPSKHHKSYATNFTRSIKMCTIGLRLSSITLGEQPPNNKLPLPKISFSSFTRTDTSKNVRPYNLTAKATTPSLPTVLWKEHVRNANTTMQEATNATS